MTVSIVNAAAAAAWAAATSQTNQMESLVSALGSNWIARIEGSGGTLRRTQTYAALTVSGTTPRSVVIGSPLTDTANSTGDITRVVLRTSGGTDILTATAQAGTGPADVDFFGVIKAACKPTLAGVTFTADPALPLTSLPTWLVGVAVNQVVAISGTSGAGGAAVDAYNGWAFRSATNEIYIAAAGGHTDSSDNRVVSLNLAANAPAWALRQASPVAPLDGRASEAGAVRDDVTHYTDGRPSSRHCYHYIHWSEQQGRVMLLGAYAPYGPAVTTRDSVDGFNPAANLWDVAGTFPNISPGYYGQAQTGTGDIWCIWPPAGARLWSAATGTFSTPSFTAASGIVRFPWAWDSSRSQLFGLAWGDSQGAGSGVRAVRQIGGTQTDITLNSIGGALAQFQTDAGEYPGMGYDAANDAFIWYDGRGARAGRFYKITPNGTTTWDISTLSVTGATVPATVSAGIHSRFSYADFGTVKGFVFMPSSSAGLYFLRTA